MFPLIQRVSFLVILLFLTILSCRKDAVPRVQCIEKTNSIDLVKKLLPGNYQWAYTRVTNQTSIYIENPATTGLNYRYEFKKDGKVDYYENNSLKSTSAYLVDYEYKVTTFPSDSATIVIINDLQSGQRKEFFRATLCSDSAIFYNPYNSIDFKRFFTRN